MMQYLIILMDDASTSYCHYENIKKEHRRISIDDLKAGILYGMKENLMIQYVLPNYELPEEYWDVMETIDHNIIAPADLSSAEDIADVVVFNEWSQMVGYKLQTDHTYVLRINKNDLFQQKALIKASIGKVLRLNVVITDVETFTGVDFETYKDLLKEFSNEVESLYVAGKTPQFNLLTDRMLLDKMNNCNAGEENITLAPDGKFYICPAFYQADSKTILGDTYSVGGLKSGLDMKNPQLYKCDHAALCRICDAYQCKRCVWMNRKTTLEVNTPSHEQCVIAHLERNASRELLSNIRKHGQFLPDKEIKEIKYLDPFDVREKW